MNKKHLLAAFVLASALAAGCQATTPATGGASPTPSAGATAQANEGDRAFIDGMVPHHQMALMMADDALAKASHQELKTFAQKVKDDQTKEINDMKSWRQAWFGSSETPAMDSSQMMNMAAGPDYDKMWAQQMIDHHQGAIDMAQKALIDAARPETKALAQRVIDAQKQEQTQLRAWIQAWDSTTVRY